jgi:predicted nucleic acid-binding protein
VLVVDASVCVELTMERLGADARTALHEDDLVAPWLLWSEVPAALSQLAFRSEISQTLAEAAYERLKTIAVTPRHPDDLIDEAWHVAQQFGWAKTYDAEYVALAKILNCRLVTMDGPLWRRTEYLGFVITPEQLIPLPPQQEPGTT